MTESALKRVDPRFLSHPPYVETIGPEVAALCERIGFAPDPEQREALDIIFGWRKDGNAAAFEFGLVCSRQNMKSALFEMCVLGWLFVDPQELITWSAHELDTTKEAFRHLTALIEGTPDFRKRLAPGTSNGVFNGNGNQMIELASGQRVKFKARTNSGGRGLTGDRMILDEALYLTATHMGSLLPTLAAVPDPQVVYGSSAGKLDSNTLRSIRDRGRAGDDPSLAFIEYSSEIGGCATTDCKHALETPGCALDDWGKRQQSNPALGRRITRETLDNMRRALWEKPEEFAREFLGWWQDPVPEDEAGDIDMAKWAKLANEQAPEAEHAHLAINIPPDLSRTSLAIAWDDPDGKPVVAVMTIPGTQQAVENIKALKEGRQLVGISLFAGDKSRSLLTGLADEGVEVETVSVAEFAEATGAFLMGIENATFVHLNQPELNAAARTAKLRNTGEAQLWDQRDLTDISPLRAATLALHGWAKNKPAAYDLLDSIG